MADRKELIKLKRREAVLKAELRLVQQRQERIRLREKPVVKERIVRRIPRETQQRIISGRRIRKQVVLDYKRKVDNNSDRPSIGYISIRVMTINPNISERGLKIVLMEAKRRFERENKFDLKGYQENYRGFENREIATNEDRLLNDGRVHVIIMVGNKITTRYIR